MPSNKTRPKKPRRDFPLFPHANGMWAKKIGGRLHYFGPWGKGRKQAEWKQLAIQAEQNYDSEKEALRAGRSPRREQPRSVTLSFCCQKYLAERRGQMVPKRFDEVRRLCDLLMKVLGVDRPVADLHPDDFVDLRRVFEGKYPSPRTRSTKISDTRHLFGYFYNNAWIENPVRFGSGFKTPTMREVRLHDLETRREHGPRDYSPAEIRTQVELAENQRMRAWVLVGINLAFGLKDLTTLRWSDLDLENGWLDSLRIKAGSVRKAKLWQRTIDALVDYRDNERVLPRQEDADYVFTTAMHARCTEDGIAKRLRPFFKRCGCYRHGLLSYGWRRSFITLGERSNDHQASQIVAGHIPADMTSQYVQRFPKERLQHVASVVEVAIFGGEI